MYVAYVYKAILGSTGNKKIGRSILIQSVSMRKVSHTILMERFECLGFGVPIDQLNAMLMHSTMLF